jgi:hypothetical protein
MHTDIDPQWLTVLDAIEQLLSQGVAPTSDNLPVTVPVLDQMINGRWITGVVIRSRSTPTKDTPWNERIISINLTPLGRRMLDELRHGNTNQPEN